MAVPNTRAKRVVFGGPGRIRTVEGVSQQIYSLPRLATSVPTQFFATAKTLYKLLSLTSMNCFSALVTNVKYVIMTPSLYKIMSKAPLPKNGPDLASPEYPSGKNILAASVAMCSLINDKVVVVRRAKGVERNAGKYELPGGKLDWRGHLEDLRVEDDIRRELKQEIGITLKKGTDDISSFNNVKFREDGRSILAFRYVGIYPEGQAVVIPEKEKQEHDAYKFVDADSYKKLEYISGIREFLDELFERQRLRGTLLANTSRMFTVHCIFVDPVTKKVLLVKSKAPQAADQNVDYKFPYAPVNSWEHLNHAIQRIVRILSQSQLTNKVVHESSDQNPRSCQVRRVAVLPSHFTLRASKKLEKVWNFYYLVHVPNFASAIEHGAAAAKFEYLWQPAEVDLLLSICSRLGKEESAETEHCRESIIKIARTLSKLRGRRSLTSIPPCSLEETEGILDDWMK